MGESKLQSVPEPDKQPRGAPLGARQLYDEQFRYVWNTLRRLGVATSDLEDLTQEVFVGALRGLKSYDPSRPLRPWLFVIALRAVRDFKQQARHRQEQGDPDLEGADPGATPEEAAASAQTRARVHEAVQSLGFDRRAVFVAHELNGHAIPEIAAALQIPVNTAYSRLRLARQDFARAIQRRARALA